MSKRQMRSMLKSMAGGGPVELTSPLASVKKLARLAFVAQQFGYEYADAGHGGSQGNALKLLIVPDPSPQARARAAQNWAQYPNAHDGFSLPPLVPDAFELLKTRITFDLTGRQAEKRVGYGALGATAGCAVLGVRLGGTGADFGVAAAVWVVLMAVCGAGFAVNRRRNAASGARLKAAGFAPVTDATGRLRYLPPGVGAGAGTGAGQGRNPYGAGLPAQAPPQAPAHAPAQPPYVPYGTAPAAAPGYGYPQTYPQAQPGPYAQAQPQPGAYAQPQPGAYPDPHPQPGAYAQPHPHAQPHPQPTPYAQPQPYPPQYPHSPQASQAPQAARAPQAPSYPQAQPPAPYGPPPQG
ncbi:hypothetical protein QFZ56_003138 [Streptomyces achromogenes]|uniref:Integral membrane protein n=2 Tax=Streptomyces achromogenes TaxID=67255 RepID=A0ABU0Q0I0_STRAH|nr:hypothetical protein [Streptomyces achromogenes]MDQ0684175.1 hypothetical protein [Streptomyces achromogenes]